MNEFLIPIVFYLSFLVVPSGIMLVSQVYQIDSGRRYLSAADFLVLGIWIIGALCTVTIVPEILTRGWAFYVASRPAWYSYDFGILFSIVFMLGLMILCILMPIYLIARSQRSKTQ